MVHFTQTSPVVAEPRTAPSLASKAASSVASSQRTVRPAPMGSPNLSAAKSSEISLWSQNTFRAVHAAPTVPTAGSYASSASSSSSTAVSSQRPYAKLASKSGSTASTQVGSGSTSSAERTILVGDFTAAYSQLNQDIARTMGGLRSNAARILTGIGTFGSIGGAVAMGFVAPVALTGLLSGVGIPHGFAAAILGAGVGILGLGLSIFAGAMVRSLTRRSLKSNPAFASKIIALKEIEANLRQQQKIDGLDHGNAALLRNTRLLLNKVDSGFGTSLVKQASNALTTPFTLFAKAFDGVRNFGRPASFDAQNQKMVPMKKRFVGERFRVSLGSQHIVASDNASAFGAATQSKAASWLKTLVDAPVALPV